MGLHRPVTRPWRDRIVSIPAPVLSWLTFVAAGIVLLTGFRRLPGADDCAPLHRAAAEWRLERTSAVRYPVSAHPSAADGWRRAAWVEGIRRWDRNTFIRLNTGSHNRLVCVSMPVITVLGEGHVLALLLALGAVVARWCGSARAGRSFFVAFAALAAAAAAPVIKAILPRTRPPGVFMGQTTLLVHPLFGGSFPSGHAMAAFGVATLLALRHPWCAPWTLGLAAAIAYSRIAVGVHFPLDVIAGSLLGCLAGWLVHRRALRWEVRRGA